MIQISWSGIQIGNPYFLFWVHQPYTGGLADFHILKIAGVGDLLVGLIFKTHWDLKMDTLNGDYIQNGYP